MNRHESMLREVLPELYGLKGNITIWALAGRRKSGKTTASDFICQLDPSFRKLSFAETLKQEFADAEGINRAYLDDPQLKEQYRERIQKRSEPFLAQDPFYYVRRTFSKVIPGQKVAIDDLRYLHELWVVLALGGRVDQIYADPYVRQARGWTYNSTTDNHLSETELGDLSADTWHCLGGSRVYNNSNKEDLNNQLFKIYRKSFIDNNLLVSV